MATLFAFIVASSGAPLTGLAPTFDYWDKASPGAPAATGVALTELVGGIGGGYFADVATTDGLEYLAIVDGGVTASPRYQRVAFSGTTDERIEVDVVDILADTAAMQPTVAANLDATVSSRESEASASTRATTNQTEHDATQTAIGLLNDLAIADIQTAMTAQGYTAARALLLDFLDAAITSRPTAAEIDTYLTVTASHGVGSWVGAGLTATQDDRLRIIWKNLGNDPLNPTTHTKATTAADGSISTPDSEIDQTVSKPNANTTVVTQA